MSKIRNGKKQFLDQLEIPMDVGEGLPLISMIGNKRLFIQNYRAIREYDAQQIVLKHRHGVLQIAGKDLSILYYNDMEIEIEGEIQSICFQHGKGSVYV